MRAARIKAFREPTQVLDLAGLPEPSAPLAWLALEDVEEPATLWSHHWSPDPHQEHQAMDAGNGTLETSRSEAVLAKRYRGLRGWQRFATILGALILAGCSAVPRTPYTAAEQGAAIPNLAD